MKKEQPDYVSQSFADDEEKFVPLNSAFYSSNTHEKVWFCEKETLLKLLNRSNVILLTMAPLN